MSKKTQRKLKWFKENGYSFKKEKEGTIWKGKVIDVPSKKS